MLMKHTKFSFGMIAILNDKIKEKFDKVEVVWNVSQEFFW